MSTIRHWMDIFSTAETVALPEPTVTLSHSEPPGLRQRLTEAEQAFDPQLEADGDSEQIRLRVEIARLRSQIQREERGLLNEQSRGLARRTQQPVEEAQGYRAQGAQVIGPTGTAVATATDPEMATVMAGAMNTQAVSLARRAQPVQPEPAQPQAPVQESQDTVNFQGPYAVYDPRDPQGQGAWDVEDRNQQTVCSCSSREAADWVAQQLNRVAQG